MIERVAMPSKLPQQGVCSLYDLAIVKVGYHVGCTSIEAANPPFDEATLKKISSHAFPNDEEHIKLICQLTARDENNTEWETGATLYYSGEVDNVRQVGFMLSGFVNDIRVTLTFEKQRITSTSCSSCNMIWCRHIIAVIIKRIRQPSKVPVHAPLTETLLSLTREQLQKLLQYAIDESPGDILCRVFQHLDQIRDPMSEHNSVQGYPDPTFGVHCSDMSTDQLSLEKMRNNMDRFFMEDRVCYSGYTEDTDNISLTDQKTFMTTKQKRKDIYLKAALQLMKKKDVDMAGRVLIQIAQSVFENLKESDIRSSSHGDFNLNYFLDVERWFSFFISSFTGQIRHDMLTAALDFNRRSIVNGDLSTKFKPVEGAEIRCVKLTSLSDKNNNFMGENKMGVFYEPIVSNFLPATPESLQILCDSKSDLSLSYYQEPLDVMFFRFEKLLHVDSLYNSSSDHGDLICTLGSVILQKLLHLTSKYSLLPREIYSESDDFMDDCLDVDMSEIFPCKEIPIGLIDTHQNDDFNCEEMECDNSRTDDCFDPVTAVEIQDNIIQFLHARQCKRDECEVHRCSAMKTLLDHIPTCNKGLLCKDAGCYQTSMLVQHWLDCKGKCHICFSLKEHSTGLYCDSASCHMCKDLRNSYCNKNCKDSNCPICMIIKTQTLCKFIKPADGSLPLHVIESGILVCKKDCEFCQHIFKRNIVEKSPSGTCRIKNCRLCSSPFLQSKGINFVDKKSIREFLMKYDNVFKKMHTYVNSYDYEEDSANMSFTNGQRLGKKDKWKGKVSLEERNRLVNKFVETIMPGALEAGGVNMKLINAVAYFSRLEQHLFDKASSKKEYLNCVVDKLYKVHREIQEKRTDTSIVEVEDEDVPPPAKKARLTDSTLSSGIDGPTCAKRPRLSESASHQTVQIVQSNSKKRKDPRRLENDELRLPRLLKRFEDLESEIECFDERMENYASSVERYKDNITERRRRIDENKSKIRSLQQSLETNDDEVKLLNNRIVSDQRLVTRLKSEVDKYTVIKVEEELKKIEEEMAKIHEDHKKFMVTIKDAENERTEIQTEINECQQQLVDNKDIEKIKLEILRQRHRPTYDAVMWYYNNKDRFTGTVHLPLMISIDPVDAEKAKLLENYINVIDLRSFFFEDKQDFDLFLNIMRFELKTTKVNALIVPQKDVVDYPVPDIETYRQYGFCCFMKDIISCPDGIMRYLCAQYNIHAVPIAEQISEQSLSAFLKTAPETRMFFSSKNQYRITKSRNDASLSSRSIPLRESLWFGVAVRESRQKQILEKINDLRVKLNDKENIIKTKSAHIQNYERNYHCLKQKQSRLNAVKENRNRLEVSLRETEQRLKTAENNLLMKNQEKENIPRHIAAFHADNLRVLNLMKRNTYTYLDLMKEKLRMELRYERTKQKHAKVKDQIDKELHNVPLSKRQLMYSLLHVSVRVIETGKVANLNEGMQAVVLNSAFRAFELSNTYKETECQEESWKKLQKELAATHLPACKDLLTCKIVSNMYCCVLKQKRVLNKCMPLTFITFLLKHGNMSESDKVFLAVETLTQSRNPLTRASFKEFNGTVEDHYNTLMNVLFSSKDSDMNHSSAKKFLRHVQNVEDEKFIKIASGYLMDNVTDFGNSDFKVLIDIILLKLLKQEFSFWDTILNKIRSKLLFMANLIPSDFTRKVIGVWREISRHYSHDGIKDFLKNIKESVEDDPSLLPELQPVVEKYFAGDFMHNIEYGTLVKIFFSNKPETVLNKIYYNQKNYKVATLMKVGKYMYSLSGSEPNLFSCSAMVTCYELAFQKCVSERNSIYFSTEKEDKYFQFFLDLFMSSLTEAVIQEPKFKHLLNMLKKVLVINSDLMASFISGLESSEIGKREMKVWLDDCLLECYQKKYDYKIKNNFNYQKYGKLIAELQSTSENCEKCINNGAARFKEIVIKPCLTKFETKKKLCGLIKLEFGL